MNFRVGVNAAISLTIALAATIPATVLVRQSVSTVSSVPYVVSFTAILVATGLLAFAVLSFREIFRAATHRPRLVSAEERAAIDAMKAEQRRAAEAYAANPHLTRTCAHLRQTELEMRADGVAMSFEGIMPEVAFVNATCSLDLGALNARRPLVPPVSYREFFVPDRYEFDNPTAQLLCVEHDSAIFTLHPCVVGPATPRFPQP